MLEHGDDVKQAVLQWGRPPEGAEGGMVIDVCATLVALQWGRPPEGAEGRKRSPLRSRGGLSCFNGAAPLRGRKGENVV